MGGPWPFLSHGYGVLQLRPRSHFGGGDAQTPLSDHRPERHCGDHRIHEKPWPWLLDSPKTYGYVLTSWFTFTSTYSECSSNRSWDDEDR
jgi:hypothetical protein